MPSITDLSLRGPWARVYRPDVPMKRPQHDSVEDSHCLLAVRLGIGARCPKTWSKAWVKAQTALAPPAQG